MKTVTGHSDDSSVSLNQYLGVLIVQTLCKAWLNVGKGANSYVKTVKGFVVHHEPNVKL